MTVLDTHIWIWWCGGNPRLGSRADWLDLQPPSSLAAGAISLWEIARLVTCSRLRLPAPVRQWIDGNIEGTQTKVIPLCKDLAIGANALPAGFHKDPADQIIAATARLLNCELVTADAKILAFTYVRTIAP